jgi:hypothetical protein
MTVSLSNVPYSIYTKHPFIPGQEGSDGMVSKGILSLYQANSITSQFGNLTIDVYELRSTVVSFFLFASQLGVYRLHGSK